MYLEVFLVCQPGVVVSLITDSLLVVFLPEGDRRQHPILLGSKTLWKMKRQISQLIQNKQSKAWNLLLKNQYFRSAFVWCRSRSNQRVSGPCSDFSAKVEYYMKNILYVSNRSHKIPSRQSCISGSGYGSNPDPIRQGFDDLKLKKKNKAEFCFVFCFHQKLQFSCVQEATGSLQPLKRQHWILIQFGSGSTALPVDTKHLFERLEIRFTL